MGHKQGKGARTRAKLKRKAARRAKAQAMKARYAEWRDKGQNSKSTRARRAIAKVYKMRPRTHPNGHCGNAGCEKCVPFNFKPFLKKGKAQGMPQQVYVKWMKLSKEEQHKAAA